MRINKTLNWLWLSVLIVGLDQITKVVATHYLYMHAPVQLIPGLNFTLMHNTGAAFSILSQAGGWQRWFFIVLAGTVSMAIIIWLAFNIADSAITIGAIMLIIDAVWSNEDKAPNGKSGG